MAQAAERCTHPDDGGRGEREGGGERQAGGGELHRRCLESRIEAQESGAHREPGEEDEVHPHADRGGKGEADLGVAPHQQDLQRDVDHDRDEQSLDRRRGVVAGEEGRRDGA